MATPSVIASVKESATRANVAPRLKNKAPELASAIIAFMTAGGAGSFELSTSRAAIHQVARNTANDTRRSTLVSGDQMKKCARVKFWRRPHEIAPADAGQHAIENTGVLFFVIDRTTWNSFPVAVTIGPQRRRISCARQGRDAFPLPVRSRQDLLCLARRVDKACQRVPIGVAPSLVEHIAQHCDGALRSESRHQLLGRCDATEPFSFQSRAEIPVVDGCVDVAIEHLRRYQGSGPVDNGCVRLEVDALTLQ